MGFRPFVYRLAHELGLAGWVRNDGAGVEIALEGAQTQVMRLIERLKSEPPALARVENIQFDLEQSPSGLTGFSIAASQAGAIQTGIAPDTTLCADCLSELFDPQDRRYRYPFINCTHCGPRYTLTARLPYDRANTSMAGFVQCPDCQAEYDAPASRRFHAQPNACPACGPSLALYDADWQPRQGDVLAATASLLRDGRVVAVKGVGGFHLVCDARNPVPISHLRGAKRREDKPFAIMVLNLASARRYAELSDDEAALLQSPERPVTLLQKSPGCDAALPDAAPGLSRIGLMLPYAPIHFLLFHELLGRQSNRAWLEQATDMALVMTSANPGGEPLVWDDDEARASLSGLAQAFLTHDRSILHRCDDSVMMWQNTAPAFVRRARGFVPRPILLPIAALPFSAPPVLACGAWLKNTICVTRGDGAYLSQHIGDLDHAGTRRVLEETVDHLCDILDVQPQAVAHDLHPDFFSTQLAQALAHRLGVPAIAVQHHHAHIASICAEHGETGPVLGLALDGVGLGTDGTAWGGELLRVEGAAMQRLGHLAELPMPGGDRAAREPWRMAAAALYAMGRGDDIVTRFPDQPGADTVATMLQRGINCPVTSSAGRLFDAAAGLLGVCAVQSYEGHAAMRLEALVASQGSVSPMADGWSIGADGTLDFQPLLVCLADYRDAAHGAALFHATLAEGLAVLTLRAAEEQNVTTVALGGGCFLNALLSATLTQRLAAHGVRVLAARQAPCNDGGIALGQAWVAIQGVANEV